MRDHEIMDLATEEDWEAANCLTNQDYDLIMDTDLRLREGRSILDDQQWAWMAFGWNED